MDDNEIMNYALKLANEAYENLEVPIGCVIVCPRNKLSDSTIQDSCEFICDNTFAILGKGRNNSMTSCNASRHAEIEAIDQIFTCFPKFMSWHECILYVTVEPCIMCIAALTDLGIKEIVFGCHNERFGGCGSTMSLPTNYSNNPPILIRHGIAAKEAINLLRKFYVRENNSAPKPKKKTSRMLKEI